MKLSRGRVLRQNDLGSAWLPVEFVASAGPALLPHGQWMPRSVMDAADTAQRILQQAQEQARKLITAAEEQARDIAGRAEAEGRAEGAAKLAANVLRFAEHEARADERSLDRSIALAQVLAERLLGEALGLDPGRVVALAQQALREARGARSITVYAHPEDVPVLSANFAGHPEDSPIRVRADPHRSRGSLRIETELGILDAEIAPQLARLAVKLRESLRHGS